MSRTLLLLALWGVVLNVMPQKVNPQQKFPREIPAGNYSGIAHIGNNRYAVVSDKAAEGGFFIFKIEVNPRSGRIERIANEGFRSSRGPNRDEEGIAFVPPTGTLFVSGEADQEILEHTVDGEPTGRRLNVPPVFKTATSNYGFEALTYDERRQQLWATTESTLPADGGQASPLRPVRNRLRLQSFGLDMQPGAMYYYETDEPRHRGGYRHYALGVCALCALPDGRMLVLEREACVKKRKIGSYVHNKIFIVRPGEPVRAGDVLSKTLLCEFRTRINLLRQNYANYEGMCLGPRLADGRQVLILVCDSQNQYKGILRDWFKTVLIE